MPSFQEFFFDSSTGVNRIYALKCLPDAAPRAVVQIAHGVADHIDRYRDFMNFLAENGFVVVGNDHLGHGKSIERPENKGFFADNNGWVRVVEDLDKLHDMTSRDYPDLPYVIFGHSMGSFLMRTYMILHPFKYDAAIICGTGHQSKALITFGYAAASAVVKAKGPRADGSTLNQMAFGAYNKKIPVQMTDFDWVNSDYRKVREYMADPFCGFAAKASLYRDMMSGLSLITDSKNMELMNQDAPVLFIAGSADPVGEYGKGVERAYKAFCKAGLHDVFMRLYPGMRHEILNEPENIKVYTDILNWLNEKLN